MKNQLVALSDALQQIVDAVEPAAAYSAKPSVSSAKYRSREVKHLSAEDITAELAVHGLDVHGAQHVTQQRLRVFLKKREVPARSSCCLRLCERVLFVVWGDVCFFERDDAKHN